MQLLAYLVLAAKLAVFALATPITNTCTPKAMSSPPARINHNTSTTNATPSSTAHIPHNTSTTNPTSSPPAPNANTSTINPTSPCSPDFLCGTQAGQGTWYTPDLGACGFENTPSQLIAAVSWMLYDTYPGYKGSDPNTNPVCGRKIHAQYKGKSVDVMVVDRCTGCQKTDLDFSPTAFSMLADQSVGRIYNMTWSWAS